MSQIVDSMTAIYSSAFLTYPLYCQSLRLTALYTPRPVSPINDRRWRTGTCTLQLNSSSRTNNENSWNSASYTSSSCTNAQRGYVILVLVLYEHESVLAFDYERYFLSETSSRFRSCYTRVVARVTERCVSDDERAALLFCSHCWYITTLFLPSKC